MLEFFIYISLGILFVLAAFTATFFFAPRHPTDAKLSSYECGEEPVGGSWIQYNIGYYLIGLIFVIVDIEVIFLIPWALSIKTLGWLAFSQMAIFMSILVLGIAYAWRKGALDWI